MCMKVLPIAEARRRLPELVRKVSQGHAPVLIGRRGRPEAVLAVAGAAVVTPKRRPLRGLIELRGSLEDLDRAQEEIRREIAQAVDRSAAELVASAPPPERRRRRRS
jgi:prevent-host-death family protein